MRIIFFGTPDFVIPVVDRLTKDFDVVAVVTAPDGFDSRKKKVLPTPIKTFATDHGIPHIFTPQTFDTETIKELLQLSPDLFVVAAYGKIIPRTVLEIPTYGAVNIHPSLLPKYRGPSPIQTALLNGDTETGITIIKMDEKMDHGPIIYQDIVSLHGHETYADLHVSLFEKAASVMTDVITKYSAGTIEPIPQQEINATYCHMITKEQGFFDRENPPTTITLDRMIRALYPWPTAWTKVRIKGQEKIMKFLPEGRIQLEGGKPMTIKDVLNGYPELREMLEGLGTRD